MTRPLALTRSVVARTTAALALVVLTLIVGCGPASAHASLTSTTPAVDARVEGSPRQVLLTFGWPPAPDSRPTISVSAPSGRDLSRDAATAVGDQVGQALAESTETGWYEVRYDVGFFDGHRASGDFRFLVLAPDRGHRSAPWLWALGGALTLALLGALETMKRRNVLSSAPGEQGRRDT